MVDCALHAVEELMRTHPECLLYGQDVGHRLGGVFREAATLAEKFGKERVFNTPIQEAFIVGSIICMSAVGLKPIDEVQFADYIWPGLNQLFTEVSRSCYLSNGKWPVSMVLRVPTGAYGSGGPYHSSSVESVVTNIRGIKIAYPSNGADLKGLLKAAYYDPNPVVIFEHKGLYWSKVPGTAFAKTIEPDADYVLPFGVANKVLKADEQKVTQGKSLTVVTYGMGVHWSLNAAKTFPGQVEIIDLRTLFPLDESLILEAVKTHNKCLVVTEEPVSNSFARSLSGLIQERCFEYLDGPVLTLGAEDVPAIPLNSVLEQTALPSVQKVEQKIRELLSYKTCLLEFLGLSVGLGIGQSRQFRGSVVGIEAYAGDRIRLFQIEETIFQKTFFRNNQFRNFPDDQKRSIELDIDFFPKLQSDLNRTLLHVRSRQYIRILRR